MRLRDEAFNVRTRTDRDSSQAESMDEADEDFDHEDIIDDDLNGDLQKNDANNKDSDFSIYDGVGLLPSWDPLPRLKTALEYYSDRVGPFKRFRDVF